MAIGDGLNLGVSDAVQAVKNAAGILNNIRNTKKGADGFAWQVTSTNSVFFKPISVDPQRWDQLFPYRLIVIDVTKGNKVVGNSSGTITTITPGSSGDSIVDFTPLNSSWIYTLPISPQQLSIRDQYAISTSSTLRGVSEEHSGVKFKMIQASGSMGVWPYRESVSKPPSTPGILQSVFGGTVQALGNVVSQVQGAVNTATNGHPANKPTTISPEASTAGQTSTGYYQALALSQFLEQYAEAKKLPKNAGWRLVFDIPKQNQSFVVTPIQFEWQQNQNKPLEVMYNFQLKAWRRVDLKESYSVAPSIQALSPGILQKILNTVTQARRVMSASIDLIGAVRSDVHTPLEVLRQTSLFVKDLSGVVATAADLPSQLQKDFSSTIKDVLSNLSSAGAVFSSNSGLSTAAIAATLVGIRRSKQASEGLSLDAVKSGQLGTDAANAQSIDPANNVFNNPDSNFTLFDSVAVTSLKLNASQQDAVDATLDQVKELTVDDLKKFKATIQGLATQLSNNFGAGSAYYNTIYGLQPPTTRLEPMTLDEYSILNTLYDVLQGYDLLTATTDVDDRNKQSNMEYVASLASTSDIQFNTSQAKVLVPVPFGLTVEAIAARYLGDPQRWLEIVTLNNLRDPYIDETGFKYSLLSNATGRQITVGSQENLYIDQRVVIYSSTQTPTARKILGLERLSDTSFLVTLDGLPNLELFTITDMAYLQAYLPGTINSQQKIYIPSDISLPDDPSITPPASVSGDPLVGLSKVDFLLTDDGDIAINSFGDFRLSAGITNIIQTLRIKMGTQKGKNLLHPNFGLGTKPGTNAADMKVQDIYDSINKMIQEDSRFQGLSSLQVQLNGPVLTVNMAVAIAGQSGVVPITFQLRN